MYRDRSAAGEILAEELGSHEFKKILVLGIPRGGVIVAAPIARRFNTGLDLLVTRKIGHPANPEVAIGAVMPDGSVVFDGRIRASSEQQEYIDKRAAEQHAEIRRRMRLYSGTETLPHVEGKTVIVTDDGIATGYTMKAAVRWLKTRDPLKIVLAVPVAPPDTLEELAPEVDLVVCPLRPHNFMSVGQFYRDFSQVSDEEVIGVLEEINRDR